MVERREPMPFDGCEELARFVYGLRPLFSMRNLRQSNRSGDIMRYQFPFNRDI